MFSFSWTSGHLVLSLPLENMDTTVTVGFAQSFSDICFNSTFQKHFSKPSSDSKYFWKEKGANTVQPKYLFMHLLKSCSQCQSVLQM